MKRVLFFLGYLSDQDIEWLMNNGSRKTLKEKEVLIKSGQDIEYLYIVLSGTLKILSNQSKIAEVGVGEVLGEMSFIEAKKPSVDVVSKSASDVLCISKQKIIDRMASDTEFKANLYYSIALFLSNRLRKTTSNMGYGNQEEEDLIDDNILDKMSQAGQRFSEILKKFNDV